MKKKQKSLATSLLGFTQYRFPCTNIIALYRMKCLDYEFMIIPLSKFVF